MRRVLCHGVFDILHAGHLAYFRSAKRYGDYLVVSITTDRFVNKGPGRPYFSHQKRAEMVGALGIVDQVFISDSATGIHAIDTIKPSFYVKGPDYKDLSKDITGEIINEKAAVESYGGQLVFTEDETHSSSQIINRFFAPWTDEQKRTIEAVNANGGIGACESAIEAIKEITVLAVGEPILDVYRFVRPEGVSSKSPSISCRFEREEIYQGGIYAIQNHLSSFCRTDLCSGRVAKKIRYISGTQRVFEVTEIDDSYAPEPIAKGYDAYVVADFGHGMFNGGELDGLKGFVGLNVQTNSSNFGFNVYTKHKRFNYLCLDTRESQLSVHERGGHPLSVARRIREEINCPFGFTCGPNGAYLLGASENFSPAFSGEVIDATGAGDAYFAITTVLLATGCKPDLVPFIGNVFAGLKTRIMGNKSAVTKADLLKALRGILA